jgi:hypothetical protein
VLTTAHFLARLAEYEDLVLEEAEGLNDSWACRGEPLTIGGGMWEAIDDGDRACRMCGVGIAYGRSRRKRVSFFLGVVWDKLSRFTGGDRTACALHPLFERVRQPK